MIGPGGDGNQNHVVMNDSRLSDSSEEFTFKKAREKKVKARHYLVPLLVVVILIIGVVSWHSVKISSPTPPKHSAAIVAGKPLITIFETFFFIFLKFLFRFC